MLGLGIVLVSGTLVSVSVRVEFLKDIYLVKMKQMLHLMSSISAVKTYITFFLLHFVHLDI